MLELSLVRRPRAVCTPVAKGCFTWLAQSTPNALFTRNCGKRGTGSGSQYTVVVVHRGKYAKLALETRKAAHHIYTQACSSR
jgi:hypothetical protein